MTSIQIDIKDGLSSSVAIKGPCRVATTANITLSGEQTIDGVAVVTDDRVLVKDQATGSENGIYIADTGAWRRAKDFNKTKDIKTGTMVNVVSGSTNAGWWQITTAGDITVGTTSIAFAQRVMPYDADLAAIAALATQPYGRSLLTLSNSTALAGELAAFYQPLDADLSAIAALSTASYGRNLLTLANQAALQTEVNAMSRDLTNMQTGLPAIDMANSTTTTAGPYFTQITATDHNVDKTSLGGLFGGVIRLLHNVGGLTMRGYRIAFQSLLTHDQKAQHAENQFVAGTLMAVGTANGAFNGTGLTAATAKGGLFGANSYAGATSGYTNLFNGTGHEFNTEFLTGSSVYYKSGLQICGKDQVQGSEIDAAISVSGSGGVAGRVGYKHGILFGSQNAGLPNDPTTGILIGDYYNPTAAIPLTAADAINLNNYTFSGSVLKTKGYIITAGGGVEAGNPASAGTVVYDFHSSGNAVDYDSRIAASGGTGVAGNGTLTLSAATLVLDSANVKFGLAAGNNAYLLVGSGAPESSQTAPVGSIYTDVGGGGTFVKQTGAGNTGWVPTSSTKPVIKTADFTVAVTEKFLINNKAGSTCTVTLPSAASFPGREINFSNYQAQTVVSASSNVVSKTGSAGTAILASGAGQWASLISDGSSWYWVRGS